MLGFVTLPSSSRVDGAGLLPVSLSMEPAVWQRYLKKTGKNKKKKKKSRKRRQANTEVRRVSV